MLVLTRRKEEKICIGPDITVTILRFKGQAVKIGIEAPSGTRILRSELIGAGRKSSANGGGPSREKAASAQDASAATRSVEPGAADPPTREAGSSEDGGTNTAGPAEPGGRVGPTRRVPRRRAAPCEKEPIEVGHSLWACG